MKMITFLLIIAIAIASCNSSKKGCAGSRYSGERYKATKFKW